MHQNSRPRGPLACTRIAAGPSRHATHAKRVYLKDSTQEGVHQNSRPRGPLACTRIAAGPATHVKHASKSKKYEETDRKTTVNIKPSDHTSTKRTTVQDLPERPTSKRYGGTPAPLECAATDGPNRPRTEKRRRPTRRGNRTSTDASERVKTRKFRKLVGRRLNRALRTSGTRAKAQHPLDRTSYQYRQKIKGAYKGGKSPPSEGKTALQFDPE